MKPSKISIKPKGARLVGVELDDTAVDLETFEHPDVVCIY
jgi:hypothetical protein